jgi:hypothetical protein
LKRGSSADIWACLASSAVIGFGPPLLCCSAHKVSPVHRQFIQSTVLVYPRLFEAMATAVTNSAVDETYAPKKRPVPPPRAQAHPQLSEPPRSKQMFQDQVVTEAERYKGVKRKKSDIVQNLETRRNNRMFETLSNSSPETTLPTSEQLIQTYLIPKPVESEKSKASRNRSKSSNPTWVSSPSQSAINSNHPLSLSPPKPKRSFTVQRKPQSPQQPVQPPEPTNRDSYVKIKGSKVFGVSLSSLTIDPIVGVPYIVIDLIGLLQPFSMLCFVMFELRWLTQAFLVTTEGIFRIPGTASRVNDVRDRLNLGRDLLNNSKDAELICLQAKRNPFKLYHQTLMISQAY